MTSKDAGSTCMIVGILPGKKEQDIHSEERQQQRWRNRTLKGKHGLRTKGSEWWKLQNVIGKGQ